MGVLETIPLPYQSNPVRGQGDLIAVKHLTAEQIAEAYLTSDSLSEAARRLGVSRPTLRKRLQKDSVQQAIQELERQYQHAARHHLYRHAKQAAQVLIDNLYAEDPRVQIAAAKEILARVLDKSSSSKADTEPIIITP